MVNAASCQCKAKRDWLKFRDNDIEEEEAEEERRGSNNSLGKNPRNKNMGKNMVR